tara:strand:+ start:28 stop:828 length:801 start_codon:yes stop_codon:yes gene_type:complete
MKQSELFEKSKGLYYYVNKNKKSGKKPRKKGAKGAPTDQDWKDAAKTAKENTNEGLAELAGVAERDHEVQMARADLYKIAKYAIKLHEMLKGVTETEGMQGWQQSKITKAADYMGSVYHAMDYENKFEGVGVTENINEAKACDCNADCECGGNCTPDCNCGPNCNESVSEGKSPHKKGSKKYKKHMAAKHANMGEDYKESIRNKLQEALKEIEETASLCPECGNPSYKTLPEEKQKGVDGKVCWKGYKRMGTKKKNGKTVDNCVKA